MRGKINVDTEAIKYLYKEYKNYLLPGLVIFVSLLLLFVSVIPQLKEVINLAKQKEIEMKKLEILNNNLKLLSSLESSVLNSQFETVSLALPQNKDFGGVIYAVEGAARRSNVVINDFGFEVGSLSDTSSSQGEFPVLTIKLNVEAQGEQIANFITELFKSVPLAEVLDVNINQKSTELLVSFYYKPISQVEIDNYALLKELSAEKLSLVNQISAWKSYPVIDIQNPTGTFSAQTVSPF